MSTRQNVLLIIVSWITLVDSLHADALNERFSTPPSENHPSTFFLLTRGNMNKTGLTKDLEAISAAGIQGILYFHVNKGAAFPGVTPQVPLLSPHWDGLISHIGDESKRLDLDFTMLACPGWATSGGPWITPDNAMRHLISSRKNVQGGKKISIQLDRPEPSSDEEWRDYREVAVLAFPTPVGDEVEYVSPVEVRSKKNQAVWMDISAGKETGKKGKNPVMAEVVVEPSSPPEALEIIFDKPTTVRSIELPPVNVMMIGKGDTSEAQILVQVAEGNGWRDLSHHVVPRSNWQDTNFPYVLALPDASATQYRLVFESERPMAISRLKFSTGSRTQDWRGQAGYTLHSMERTNPPAQNPKAWVRSADIVDITQMMDAKGQLHWNAPAGNWTVVRFGHVNTGAKNKPAPAEATGWECDKFSKSGIDKHFESYIGRMINTGCSLDGGRMTGVEIDSWEARTQTWTPAMEKEFETRQGYSLRRWLPALAGWVVDDHRTSERFLRDWRNNINDLTVDNYFGRMAELAKARGLESFFETSIGDVIVGDILQYYSKVDTPMCEIWRGSNSNFDSKAVWPTVSAAHVYGKKRVACETLTRFGVTWDEGLSDFKPTVDRALSRGITRVFFHTFTHNPLDRVPGTSFGSDIGSPFVRGQTWWKHMPQFTDYIARCSFMLERGLPVEDVLWYLGDDLDHKPVQVQPFSDGYRFSYFNSDVLHNRLSVRDGLLTIPEGTSWRVIWLPREQCARLTPATLGKLKQLIEAGATVIGEVPEINPTLRGGAESDRQFSSLVKELWGDKPQRTGNRKIGKGQLMWGEKLDSHLAKLGIEEDVAGADANSAAWLHRRDKDADIYFIVAEKEAMQNTKLRFRAQGIPEFWNPLTGKTTPVHVLKQDQTGTTIVMNLSEGESIFVVFRPGVVTSAIEQIVVNGKSWLDVTGSKQAGSGEANAKSELPAMGALPGNNQFVAWADGDYQFKPQGGSPVSRKIAGTRSIPVNGGWSLSFPKGWDAPEKLDLGALKPWSELEDKATRHFSGSAIYRTTLNLEKLKADERAQLDLGHVENVVDVRINGIKVGVIWVAPFRLDITEFLKAGDNAIEIEVTNTWHNRLVYDTGLPEAQRKTWTIWDTKRAPKADSQLKIAGLKGPVQVRVGKIIRITGN